MKKCISKRFNFSKKRRYDFLAGRVIIARQNVPPYVPPAFKNQQKLALALESQLIEHLSYVQLDRRLANTSLHPGCKSKPYAGHAIYLAVKICRDC